ncbi:MAG TPA: hypothetical protein VJB08_07420 [Candidatus Nanoarchaeia archaeon]|nr:hypothetical protein [Candidatus Nanoarchaeia archaeon]
MRKCIHCKRGYKEFMMSNYNLGLCRKCFDAFEDRIDRDDSIDEVTHKITCPKCRHTYDFIVDEQCKTKNCNVWFFWDDLDCRVIARWVTLGKAASKK